VFEETRPSKSPSVGLKTNRTHRVELEAEESTNNDESFIASTLPPRQPTSKGVGLDTYRWNEDLSDDDDDMFGSTPPAVDDLLPVDDPSEVNFSLRAYLVVSVVFAAPANIQSDE